MSLTSETRSAALSVSRSASTPGSRAQRIASRTSEVEIRTCRMRSSRTKRWMLASTRGLLSARGRSLQGALLAEPEGPGALARADRALLRWFGLAGARLLLVLAARGAVYPGVAALLVLRRAHGPAVGAVVVLVDGARGGGRGARGPGVVVAVPVPVAVPVTVTVVVDLRVGVDELGQGAEGLGDVLVVLDHHRHGVGEDRAVELV